MSVIPTVISQVKKGIDLVQMEEHRFCNVARRAATDGLVAEVETTEAEVELEEILKLGLQLWRLPMLPMRMIPMHVPSCL